MTNWALPIFEGIPYRAIMSLVAEVKCHAHYLQLFDPKQMNLLSLKNLDCASVGFLYCGWSSHASWKWHCPGIAAVCSKYKLTERRRLQIVLACIHLQQLSSIVKASVQWQPRFPRVQTRDPLRDASCSKVSNRSIGWRETIGGRRRECDLRRAAAKYFLTNYCFEGRSSKTIHIILYQQQDTFYMDFYWLFNSFLKIKDI